MADVGADAVSLLNLAPGAVSIPNTAAAVIGSVVEAGRIGGARAMQEHILRYLAAGPPSDRVTLLRKEIALIDPVDVVKAAVT